MKVCTKCGEDKPFADFYRHAGMTDGHTNECRACMVAAARRWNQTNRERKNATNLAYFHRKKPKRDLELGRAQSRLRRERVARAPGSATRQQIADRIAYYAGLCWMCHRPADTLDHVIPIARGGSLWPANVRPACLSCNSSKGTS